MTDRQKDKLLIFALVKSLADNERQAINFIRYSKEFLDFDTLDKRYKKAMKEYRRNG